MANAVVDTGHGATATLSSSAYSFNWTSLDLGEETLEPVDTTHLGTSGYRTSIPGDLKSPGQVTMPHQFDAEAAQIVLGTVETLTITFPQESGQSAAATLVGTGFFLRHKRPNLQTDTIQDGELVFQFNGLTGPTFTAATAV